MSVAPAIIPITCKKPEYPTESFKANESGSVLLRFFINVDGDVTQSQIERSSGYDRLDEAARTVLQACKFRPGSINGRPVAAWAPVEYTWRIQGGQPPSAAAQNAVEAVPMNTFRFVGGALICKSDTPDPASCLRIGGIKIGDSYQRIRGVQNPFKEVALADGVTASAYVIGVHGNESAYWVIGHRDEKIVSIQLTGNFAHADYSFSTIRLADPEQKVREILGPRYAVRDVAEVGGVVWDYAPFPITIEMVKGKVYSIRLADN